MRSTGIFDRLLVVLMSLNTFYLDGYYIVDELWLNKEILVVKEDSVSSRPKIPVDCGAWVGIPDISPGGDPPTPPPPYQRLPFLHFLGP